MTNWLTDWTYRKSHAIGNATGAGTNYQVCIKVYKTTGTDGNETVNGVSCGKVYVGANCRDDFGDIRFTDNDGDTLLDYWMESFVSGTSAIFWVEVRDSLESAPQTIYIYYKKDDATTVSDGTNTFPFFDDFLGSALNTTKWDNSTIGNLSVAVDSSVATLTLTAQTADTNHYIKTKDLTFTYYACRFRMHDVPATYSAAMHFGYGVYTWNPTTNCVLRSGSYTIDQYCLVVENGTSRSVSSGYAEDADYSIWEVQWTAANATLLRDGTAKSTLTTNVPTGAIAGTMGITKATATYTYGSLIDWYLIRKFVVVEPTHGDSASWGNEESSGPTAYNKTVVDLVGAVSTFVKHRGVHKTLADIVSGVGTFVKHYGRLRIFTGKLGAIDSKLRHIFRLKTLTDKLGIVGSKIRITTLFRTFVSLLGLKDTKTKSIARLKTFIQLIGLKDSISSITKTLHRIFTGTIGAVHTFWKQKFTGGAQDIVKELSDILGVIDSKTNIISRIRLFLDKIGAKDSKTNSHIYIKILLDKLGLKDSKFVSYVSGTFRWVWKEHPKVKVEKQ